MTARKVGNFKLIFASLFVALVMLSGFVTAAIAHTDSGTQTTASTGTEECRMIDTAVSNAVKNQLSIVDMFMNAAEKNAKRIMSNSCLSALQMLDFNLAGLIPDFSLLGTALDAAINRVVTYLTDQVCEAVDSQIGNWNELVNGLKLDWNANSQLESWANDVIMEIPGGSAPVFSGNHSGVIGSKPLEGGSNTPAPVTCQNVGDYDVCSDGSTRVANSGGASGNNNSGSNGSGSGGSNYGAQIGSTYAQKFKECEDAKSRWQRAYNSDASWDYIENIRISSLSVCNSALSHYNSNMTYLSSMPAPSIPAAMKTATPRSGGVSSNSFSLPVRN